MSTILTPDGVASAAAGRRRRIGFYVPLALLMTAFVIAGFFPYVWRMLNGRLAAVPLAIHLHAAVFFGWMFLLLLQTSLVAAGRRGWHVRVGRVGIAYGIVLFAAGLLATVIAPALHVKGGSWTMDEAAAFLILPLGDMALFAVFFAAAIGARRRPEHHKRWIVLATVALLFAPVARLVDGAALPLLLAVWLLPLLIAMAVDGWRLRRVHPVYAVGIAALLLASARIPLMDSEWWLPIGRSLMQQML